MRIQKRLAGQLMKTSPKKIRLEPERILDITEAITKTDIRALIADGAITKKPDNNTSRSKANKTKDQKNKGRQKGQGSRKGKKTARLPRKEEWMNKIRKQRAFLKDLKDREVIEKTTYRNMYRKSGGGFFRSVRHIKLYLNDNNLFVAKKEDKN